MVVARFGAKRLVGFLGFLVLMLVAVAVMAQPADAQMQGSADLSVQKFDFPPTQVFVGEPLFYELNIANSVDSDTAANAVVVDDLPSNTEFLFTISGNCTSTGQTVTCNLGDVAPGELTVVEFAVCPLAPGTATNTATASSDTPDPDNSNNTATETTEVTGPDVGGCTTPEPPAPQEPAPPNNPQPMPGPMPESAPPNSPQQGPGPTPPVVSPQPEGPERAGLCGPGEAVVINDRDFSLVCAGGQAIVALGDVPGGQLAGGNPENGAAVGGAVVRNPGNLVAAGSNGATVQSSNNDLTVEARR